LARIQELTAFLREWRERGLLALKHVGGNGGADESHSLRIDMRALDHRAAKLRAVVAERDRDSLCHELLERMAVTADLREDASGEHGYRVGALSRAVAKTLGWTDVDANILEQSARLHDIGKLGIPDRILFSSEALQSAQRSMLETHVSLGSELLSRSTLPEVRIAQQVALHHHEWWNGNGYPWKLAGKRIPIHARIVALADVFDALTHGRPFSPPWPVEKALAEIRSRRATQFDPELTDIFLNLMDRLIAEHEDLDEYLGRASRHSPFLQARNKIRRMLETERENEKLATASGNQTRH
jgi:putative two-component system response regulator